MQTAATTTTARQRVTEALAHRQPPRVPFSWGFGPTSEMATTLQHHLAARGLDWPRLQRDTEDVLYVAPTYTGPHAAAADPSLALWGIHVTQADYTGGSYREFTDFPLAGLEDPAALTAHPWPDASTYDYATLRQRILQADPDRSHATKYVAGNPFEIYCWMTGLEEAMINLAINPALVQAALERITDFFEQRLRRVLHDAGDLIDIVFFADDLGGQTSLLMSRPTYRAVLQPFHRRLFDCAHALAPDAKVMLHSDGAVFDVLPDLVDIGLDVLEAVQTDAAGMDPLRLKQTFGRHLSFHGGISVQQLLPKSDAPTVERECRRLVDVFGTDGGYIAAPSHAIQVGTPPENVLAMLRAVLGVDLPG